MASEIFCDDRGRLLLTKDVREEYGEKFILVRASGELVLIPIPDDPIKDLQELGQKLPKHLSINQLKKIGIEGAIKNVKEELESLKKIHNKNKK